MVAMCAMNATELQNRLASLAPGETVMLPVAEIEWAFHSYPTPEERHAAAAGLAAWYGCSVAFCGPNESQILFTRVADSGTTNFAEAHLWSRSRWPLHTRSEVGKLRLQLIRQDA